jgi:hypothetical protein
VCSAAAAAGLTGAVAVLHRYPRGFVVRQFCLAAESEMLTKTDKRGQYRATEAARKRHRAIDAYKEYIMLHSAKESRRDYERELQGQAAAYSFTHTEGERIGT